MITRSQAEHLRSLGCDRGQGFLYARPVPAERLTELLRTGPNYTTPAGDLPAAA